MNPMCPEHGLEAQVKTGLRYRTGARAGRPIPPFYGCPWTGVGPAGEKIYCQYRFEEKPTETETMVAGTGAAVQRVTDKDTQIKFMNALNNAALLVANGKIEPGPGEDVKDLLERYAEIIYRMTPPA